MTSTKTNIELFRPDLEFDTRMFNVSEAVNEIQQVNLWLLKDTFINSQYLGGYIWDNNLSDLSGFFTRDYWINNFSTIIAALEVVGTYDAYTAIIRSALGTSTEILYESDVPGHLRIIIDTETAGVDAGALYVYTIEQILLADGNTLAFELTQSPLTIQETEALIRLLVPNGIFLQWSEGVIVPTPDFNQLDFLPGDFK